MPLTEQMVGMQATHHAFDAIQQVLASRVQFLETSVQGIKRHRLYLDASNRQRVIFLSIRVTDVDHDMTGQRLADFFNLQILAQFVDHSIDRYQFGPLERPLENRHVELLFFVLHAVALGVGLGVHRNDPAIFRHVLGEIRRADLGRQVDDVLLMAGDQRANHQLLGYTVDHRQVRQRLAGHLGDRLAGHQRADLQAIGHDGSSAQHHTLQYYAHMTVIDFAENFSQHFLERHTDKQHPLGAAVLLPEEVGDFHHPQFVGAATEVEEAEMAHQAAAHHLIGGHGGIETAGHQHQGLLDGTQRVAAQAIVLAMDNKQPLVANFHPHFDFRLFEGNPSGIALSAQLAADVFLHIHGAETVLAGALATHRKNLPGQGLAEVLFALGGDLVEVTQRVFVDLQEMRDARHAAQALGQFLQGLGLAQRGFQLEIVPHAVHHHVRVQVTEHGTDVLGQLADEFHPDRAAFNGDFGEDFYDKFHENSARRAGRKRGARIIAEIAQGLTSYCADGFERTKTGRHRLF